MNDRKPAAFRLDQPDVAVIKPGDRPAGGARVVVEEAIEPAGVAPEAAVPERTGIRWGRLLAGALSALVTLAIGLWIDDLVQALFARQDWLGWTALALVALVVLSFLAIVAREVSGLIWIGRIDRLRDQADIAATADDGPAATAVVASRLGLYAERVDLAAARLQLASHATAVIDGRDRLVLAEASLLAPLDERAARLVTEAARRVSVVTAVSPRALIDVAFVFFVSLRLIRQLAALYGGRPGLLRFVRLTRLVMTHLVVTGSIAIGDGLAQQLVGHGLAAKLSARLGEGVVNGMLTARVGLSAIDVCRPLPFLERSRPGVSEVMASLVSPGGQ